MQWVFKKYFLAVTCSPLSLVNGRVSYDMLAIDGEYDVSTVATFTCNYGYSKSGCSTSTCGNSGNWSKEIPICNQST